MKQGYYRGRIHVIFMLLLFFMTTAIISPPAYGDVISFKPVPKSLQHEPPPVPDLSGVNTLSIEEALNRAYKYNPDLRKAELQLDRAEILLEEAGKAVTFLATGDIAVAPGMRVAVNNYEQALIGYRTAKKAAEAEQARMEKDVVVAYAGVVKSLNQIELAQIALENYEQQAKLNQLAIVHGVLSNYDNQMSLLSLKQLKENVKLAEAAHQMAMAKLRNLLFQRPDWNPVLTSRPVIEQYKREDVSVEISRGADESIMQLAAKQAMDLENIKQYWGTLNQTDPYMDKINRYLKELDYEQAQRDTRSTISELYHQSDILQQRISMGNIDLKQKEENFKINKLKYDIGIIPFRSITPGENMASAQLALSNKQLELENLRADLVMVRANFGYITGQQVYSKLDWNTVSQNSSGAEN